METITQKEIEEATKRYADALIKKMIVSQKLDKLKAEEVKAHNEVVLAFQDLQALRLSN